MALIDRQSDRWTELFGHLDEVWTSEQAPHQAFVDGLVDPSLWPSALGNGPSMSDVMHAQGVKDIYRGTQHLVRHIVTAVELGGGSPGAASSLSTGFPSQLGDALTNVLTPQSVASSIPADLVKATLTDTNSAGGKVATALFATGMTALSAAGPIGMAAAAIVGLAFTIFKAFDNAKKWKEKEKEERIRRAFESFPPLQQPGDDTDEWYVRKVIFPILETGNWTSLFSPRFNPRKEWVGAPRNGGYGFAPGERHNTKDEFGIDTGIFETGGGVGFLPGFNRITSVIQVSIEPFGPTVQSWMEKGGHFPIKKSIVQDVGSFYVNTGRLCSIAWSWATAEDASPNLYKIHVGTRDGDAEDSLHYLWRNYMQGGLEFLRENGHQWADWSQLGLNPGGRVKDKERPEFLLGSAIGCAVGSWTCSRALDSTNNNPRFVRVGTTPPGGYPPGQYDVSQGLPNGCVIEPMTPGYTPKEDDKPCLVSLYDSHLVETLDKLRKRQIHYLRHSLVCAYVREGWDAFKDPELLELLRNLRTKLLTHKDRFLVQMRDVPRDELHNGKDWREQLKASGINEFLAGGGTKLAAKGPGAGAIEPETEPAPLVPVDGQMPFAGRVPPATDPWWRDRRIWTGAGLTALTGAVVLYGIKEARR